MLNLRVSAWPKAVGWICFSIVSFFFLWVGAKVPFNDGLLSAFESQTEEFENYKAYLDNFPHEPSDVLVYLNVDDLAATGRLKELSDLVFELQFLDEVSGVLSPLLFCIGQGAEWEACPFLEANWSDPKQTENIAEAHERWPTLRSFLAEDRRAVLLVVAVPELSEEHKVRQATLAKIKNLAEATLTAEKVRLAGYPVVRDRLSASLFSQIALISLATAVLGAASAIYITGSLKLGMLAIASAVTALTWSVGAMVLLGFEYSFVTAVMPTLILVVALTASMHLMLEVLAQQKRETGQAISRAFRRILPAAFLAALTTSIALGSLTLSPANLIADLGRAGFIAPLVAVFTVAVTLPLFLATFGMGAKTQQNRQIGRLRWGRLANLSVKHSKQLALTSLVLLGLTGWLHLQLPNAGNIFDGLQPDDPILQTVAEIETKMAPVGRLQFLVPSQPEANLKRAVEVLQAAVPDGHVFANLPSSEPANDAEVPSGLRERVVSKDGSTSLISVLHAYENAAKARREIARLQAALSNSDVDAGIVTTGLIAMSVSISAKVASAFNICFFVALLTCGLLIILWQRNLVLGLVTLIPNMLPATTMGTYLYLSGEGMNYAGGLALTIAFGIAVDDTLHVLNRLRLTSQFSDQSAHQIVVQTMQEVSPALITSTFVLVVGSMGALFSTMPSIQQFAELSILVFILALVCDLILLPALLLLCARFWHPTSKGLS